MSSIILPWERGAAYDEGARTPLGQMSPQELEEARQYYTDQIMKMEEGILRYQVETIEQYGTVRSAMEQQRTAIAQAIIQAEGRISAARIEGAAEVKAAQYVVDLRMIDENINGSKHTQDRLWNELTKETSESWVGSDTQASAAKVWAGDGNYQTWLDSYQQGAFFRGHVKKANKNMDGLDPLNKVVYANNANNLMMGRIGSDIETYNREIDAKLAKQLKAGEITHEQLVENGARMRVPQEEILRLQQKVPGLVSVSAEDRATAEDKIAANQMRLDEIRKDPATSGYLSYDLLGEAMAPTDYDSFIKDLSKAPVPERAKKRIEELEASRAALGGTDAYGKLYNQFMMGGRGDYITQLLGFNSSDDAFRSLIGNPNAQSHIADIYSQRAYHAGATIGDERLEGLEPGIEKARAALAEKLGMKTTDPNDLRLRLKAFRTEAPPLPQPTAVTGAAPAAAQDGTVNMTSADLMKALEQASQSGYEQGIEVGSQAEQTAVAAGKEQAAKIKGETPPTAKELLEGGTAGDKLSAEQQKLLDLYNASPPAMQEALRPMLEDQGLLHVAGVRSSFNVSDAKTPPKTRESSFSTPATGKAPPKHIPPDIRDTPEHKADMKRRQESYQEYEEARERFESLPEWQQKKVAQLGDTYKKRMQVYDDKGGQEMFKKPDPTPRYSSPQAEEQERRIREQNPSLLRDPVRWGEKQATDLIDLAGLGGTTDTSTTIPKAKDTRNTDLAAKLNGKINNTALDKLVKEGKVTKEQAASIYQSLE